MKKHSFMKEALTLVGVCVLIFTALMAYYFYVFQAVPDSLVAAFYIAAVGEGGFCAFIRRAEKESTEVEENE